MCKKNGVWRCCRGRSDRCKKGGAGGKFNWGATVDIEADWVGGVQDRGDPNYDSDLEADRHMRLKSIPIDNAAGCKKEARSAFTPIADCRLGLETAV